MYTSIKMSFFILMDVYTCCVCTNIINCKKKFCSHRFFLLVLFVVRIWQCKKRRKRKKLYHPFWWSQGIALSISVSIKLSRETSCSDGRSVKGMPKTEEEIRERGMRRIRKRWWRSGTIIIIFSFSGKLFTKQQHQLKC